MPINSIAGISREQSLLPTQAAKRSALSSLAKRISDFFKNKIFPLFKRAFECMISPFRRRKVSVQKAPLPQGPNAVAKKAQELLPPALPAASEKPKQTCVPPIGHPTPASAPVKKNVPDVNQVPVQSAGSKPQRVVQKPPPQAIEPAPRQMPAAPPTPPARLTPQAPLPEREQKVVAKKVIPFTITIEIQKLTVSLSAVLKQQEDMLTKFKSLGMFSSPESKDIQALYDQYQQMKNEGNALAAQLSSYTHCHHLISERIKTWQGLAEEANQGMIELEPMRQNGVKLGGMMKILKGSSPAKEIERGFDLIRRYREAIQAVLQLPNS